MNNTKKYEAFLKKLEEKTLFFMNSYETIVMKSVPSLGYFVKFKGEKEVFVKKGNSVVLDTIVDYFEITEEKYNNFY